jgi:hypothetical protein
MTAVKKFQKPIQFRPINADRRQQWQAVKQDVRARGQEAFAKRPQRPVFDRRDFIERSRQNKGPGGQLGARVPSAQLLSAQRDSLRPLNSMDMRPGPGGMQPPMMERRFSVPSEKDSAGRRNPEPGRNVQQGELSGRMPGDMAGNKNANNERLPGREFQSRRDRMGNNNRTDPNEQNNKKIPPPGVRVPGQGKVRK